MGDDFFRGVVARYTQRSISSSIYRDILDLINAWGLTPHLKINGEEIVNAKNGNMILTHSMKISEGTTVAKGKGLSNVTHLLIDEATEMASEEEYIKLIDSFRTKGERKIFLCFNPTSKAHWLFKRFYLPSGEPNPKWKDTHGFLHTTYLDNKDNLDPSKVREWELAKETDRAYFDHHIMGVWKDAGDGQVFKNWHWGEHLADWDAETIWGLDFGFASDPCALIQVKKRGNKIWLKEFIYETGLTTEDLSHLMDLRGVPRHAHIYADSSDPKSIETLRRLGWNNIRPCVKGPDSIRHGIDTINSYEVYASYESENLRLEYDNYVYRAGGDRPSDSWNHLMDSARYAIGTGLKIGQAKYVLMGSGKKRLGLPV
jgi:phage terminase large subunit